MPRRENNLEGVQKTQQRSSPSPRGGHRGEHFQGWLKDTSQPVLQITWTARFGSQAGDIQPAEVQQEVVVSYLPLSHIAAQIYDLWTGIQWGAQVCFAEPDALKVSPPPCPCRYPSVCVRTCLSVSSCLWALHVCS